MIGLGSMFEATLCCGDGFCAMQAQVVRGKCCTFCLGCLGDNGIVVYYAKAIFIMTDHFRELLF